MPPDRLTHHELSWLLAQEARGAAQALRQGVTQLRQPVLAEPQIIRAPVENNLDALEDAIDMLSALNTKTREKSRRGRIDLAALLFEIAPNARISIEPGAGTEVYGDESDLRRMVQLLINQADSSPAVGNSASAVEVIICREGEWVKVGVELGPDTGATQALERRWLSRMATRYGGSVELERGTQTLLLPADGASDRREVIELRKELEQAQQLGEAYARELATVISMGDRHSEIPAIAADAPFARFELLFCTASALQRAFRAWLDGLRVDINLASKLEGSANLVENLTRHLGSGQDLLGDLSWVLECPLDEHSSESELVAIIQDVIAAFLPRSQRLNVELKVELPRSLVFRTQPLKFKALLRALIYQALLASPRGDYVLLKLDTTDSLVTLVVEDGGPCIPEASAHEVIRHRVDPHNYGRPAGISLLVSSVLAECLGNGLLQRVATNGRTEIVTTFHPPRG